MTAHPLTPKPNGPAAPQATPVPPAAEALALETERIEVNLADVQLDPDNAHKHTPQAIEALAASIRAIGLINEPFVFRDPQTGLCGLLAGEGRVRAMIHLGWLKTFARCLKEAPGPEQRARLSLVDNLVRDESLSNPVAFGLACHDHMLRTGISARELARVLPNKSASTITRAVARVRKLPPAVHDLMRGGRLTGEAADVLVALPDDQAKLDGARLYAEGKVKSAAALRAALRAAGNGASPAAAASFTFQEKENGVRVVVTLPGQDPAAAAPALRQLLKALRDHGNSGLGPFKEYLDKRGIALRKAAELQSARDALAAS